jgi:hypothetical protein
MLAASIIKVLLVMIGSPLARIGIDASDGANLRGACFAVMSPKGPSVAPCLKTIALKHFATASHRDLFCAGLGSA